MTSSGGPGNGDLGAVYEGLVPLRLEAGYRFTSHLMGGVFFQYALGLPSHSGFLGCGSAGVTCSGDDLVVGAQLHYHPWAGRPLDPWAGLSFGYETGDLRAWQEGIPAGVHLHGFEAIALQLGADYRATPTLSLGPFIELAMGEFFWCSYSGVAASALGASCSIDHPALHGWLTVGARGVLDIGG